MNMRFRRRDNQKLFIEFSSAVPAAVRCIVFYLVAGTSFVSWGAELGPLEPIRPFLSLYCLDCHEGNESGGGLDLTRLDFNPRDENSLTRWIQIHDRVKGGEMPPDSELRPDPKHSTDFLASLSGPLLEAERERQRTQGRSVLRRLNRDEYEDTLRDLLALPWLEVRERLPEDGESRGFNKVSDALHVSQTHLARLYDAAGWALRSALAPRIEQPLSRIVRLPAAVQQRPQSSRLFHQGGLLPKDAVNPDAAVLLMRGSYQPEVFRFEKHKARLAGPYRLRLSARGMTWDRGDVLPGERLETVSIYARDTTNRLRLLGHVDFPPDRPAIRELDVHLHRNEVIQLDPSRLVRPFGKGRADFKPDRLRLPAIAVEWLEIEGPRFESWPPPGHRLLFGDLEFQPETEDEQYFVISSQPLDDARRLLRGFLDRALRREADDEDVDPYLRLVEEELRKGTSFSEAMLGAYSAILCSPGFLYLHEPVGVLEGPALAARLSYFLWNSAPDAELSGIAKRGRLNEPETLRIQTERLLKDPRSRRFVERFLDGWLDLRAIGETDPDAALYPEYHLDDLLAQSLLEETRAWFEEMIRLDMGVGGVAGADFAMLNVRLAEHYGLPEVEGVELRRVPLPPGSVRGGLLTQGSVLKVTANGTNTSPVSRGVWLMERVLGERIPPPPATVSAAVPDERGATTIREALAAHRDQQSCAVCHRRIDPPGFALESFDVMGAWRDRYRGLEHGDPVEGRGRSHVPFEYRLTASIDAAGDWDGRAFRDIREFKDILKRDEPRLARNLVEGLIEYSTGAPAGFADRPIVDDIVERLRDADYGVRAMIHEVVQSPLFLRK